MNVQKRASWDTWVTQAWNEIESPLRVRHAEFHYWYTHLSIQQLRQQHERATVISVSTRSAPLPPAWRRRWWLRLVGKAKRYVKPL